MWGDEGFVVRFPEVEQPPDPMLLLPDPDEVEGLALGSSAPRRCSRPGSAKPPRAPCSCPAAAPARGRRCGTSGNERPTCSPWPHASGLFRSCWKPTGKCCAITSTCPALVDTLRKLSSRTLRVTTIDSQTPSPFAASLLFSYVANYIYDGDAPLAERRAQALSVDQAQLRELLGDAELRELLDPEALEGLERQLQHLTEGHRVRSLDGLHDLLIRIGDLGPDEIAARSDMPDTPAAMDALERERRVIEIESPGNARFIAVEDAARYRDALGVPLPPGIPESLLEPVRDAAGDL